MKKFVHIDIEKFKENYRKVRRILSKVYEIYHMIMIFCFCVVIDMILVGVFIVWPFLWIIEQIPCPF